VADAELLAAGVASTASTGRLIDRFRDRAILPVIHDGQILGFVGRRHPDAVDGNNTGPKYLNTGDTIVFHKGAQLYGIADDIVALGSIPVLVEGPIDAIAVTLATAGSFVGVAPLGTSLTHDQAAQLARLGTEPIVATDGDLAGRVAAERDFWLLAPHLVDPRFARFKSGEDPASVLERHGRNELVLALQNSRPLAEELIAERLANIEARDQLAEPAQVIAARPAQHWPRDIASLAHRIGTESAEVEKAVATYAADFSNARRRYSSDRLDAVSVVRERLEHAANATPAERWAPLARSLSPALLAQHDWPATAELIQQVHEAGHDVARLTRRLIAEAPLDGPPAKDLRYRLVGYLSQAPERDTWRTEHRAERFMPTELERRRLASPDATEGPPR
jgi:DNA primase